MSASRPPSFKELDYLGQRWHAQIDRPLAEMGFYQRAHALAEIAFASYWAEEYMVELCKHFGFHDVQFFSAAGAQTFVLGNDHDTVVACRGTIFNDWDDIRANLKAWMTAANPVGRVHRGFKGEVDRLWPGLGDALRASDRPLYFTGHSLGGAMAQICTARCKLDDSLPTPLELQTFGCPRVGDRRFVNHCQLRKIRWINHNDFVPRFPPALFGYRHVGLEMYIDGAGKISGLSGLRRFGDRLLGFARGLGRARLDHFGDHLMPGYIAPLLNAARAESA